MSKLTTKLTTAIFGVIAVSVSFGAAQIAAGRDLSSAVLKSSDVGEPGINRAAKADRAAIVAGIPGADPDDFASLRWPVRHLGPAPRAGRPKGQRPVFRPVPVGRSGGPEDGGLRAHGQRG